MNSLKEEKKRLVIYSFFDNVQFVDDYILEFLVGIKKAVSYVIVIAPKGLKNQERTKITRYADEVVYTDTSGKQNYQQGIQHAGYSALNNYDEIILCSNEWFGPLCPFSDLFTLMHEKTSDFWSVSKKNAVSFIAFSKRIILESHFRKFWDREYARTEMIQFFLNAGYKFETYVEDTDVESAIVTKKCPIISKTFFCGSYDINFVNRHTDSTKWMMNYITEKTPFDSGLIWKYLIRTQNMADIKKNMQLNYVVSSKIPHAEEGHMKIALVLHIYFSDLALYCRKYAESMPEGTDVYITVPDKQKLEEVKKAFENFPYHTEYRITGNRGRDVAPFVVGCKDVIDKYDLICKMHDKKVFHVHPMSLGHSWSYKCFECLLRDKTSVNNIIALFQKYPYLGMVCPPVPNHGPYYPITGKGEWGSNYSVVKKLAEELRLHVDISSEKEPVAPLGSMFWARAEALKPLFAHDWQYEEIPEEPLADDATILHAIERIYPFCVQEAGYYTAWVMTDHYARIELDNLEYLNQGLLRAEMEKSGKLPFHDMLEKIRNRRSEI